jgi:hypothetical protein
VRRERPCRRAAEERDEIAASNHSISSLALRERDSFAKRKPKASMESCQGLAGGEYITFQPKSTTATATRAPVWNCACPTLHPPLRPAFKVRRGKWSACAAVSSHVPTIRRGTAARLPMPVGHCRLRRPLPLHSNALH